MSERSQREDEILEAVFVEREAGRQDAAAVLAAAAGGESSEGGGSSSSPGRVASAGS